MNLDPLLQNAAARTAQQLLDKLGDARAVVIATEDGFDVAHATRGTLDPSRIAAMTSSIAAIGDVISREAGIGSPNCFVVDASDGFLVLRTVQCDSIRLVIATLATRNALLGLVMHAVTAASKELTA